MSYLFFQMSIVNWSFRSIDSDWTGGHVPSKNPKFESHIRIKTSNTKMKGVQTFWIYKYDDRNPKEKIDYIRFNIKKFKSEEEYNKKVNEIKYKYYQSTGSLFNMYRYVTLSNNKSCVEIQLNNGFTMLIENKHLDKVKKYNWTTNMKNNRSGNKSVSVLRTFKDKNTGKNDREYLTDFLYPDIGIKSFKDNTSLNFLEDNVLASGKTKTVVKSSIKINNSKINQEYLRIINETREKRDKIYHRNGNFKFDKILSHWFGDYTNLCIKISDNTINLSIQNKNGYIKPLESIEYNNDNETQILNKVKNLKKLLQTKYHKPHFNNYYRYVIFNEQQCLEMKLTKGITTIFDKKHLRKINEYKWRSNPHGNGYRVISNDISNTYLHQYITNNVWVKVDHIDGNPRNNLDSNLRDGQYINDYNRKLQSNNTSGINGIGWDESQNRWRVRYRINKKEKMKGFPAKLFGSKQNALEAAVAFKVSIDKELGNTNGIRV